MAHRDRSDTESDRAQDIQRGPHPRPERKRSSVCRLKAENVVKPPQTPTMTKRRNCRDRIFPSANVSVPKNPMSREPRILISKVPHGRCGGSSASSRLKGHSVPRSQGATQRQEQAGRERVHLIFPLGSRQGIKKPLPQVCAVGAISLSAVLGAPHSRPVVMRVYVVRIQRQGTGIKRPSYLPDGAADRAPGYWEETARDMSSLVHGSLKGRGLSG